MTLIGSLEREDSQGQAEGEIERPKDKTRTAGNGGD